MNNDLQRYPPVDDDVMNRIQGHSYRDAAVYYHFVGTPQCKAAFFHSTSPTLNQVNEAADILILHDKDHPEWIFGTTVSEDGKYLYMEIFKDAGRVLGYTV
jgi:Prolyl oligopeptidase, N-terminal beta-propeller domain